MPDITQLILDEHETFRRRFAELDDKRASNAPVDELEQVWAALADLLERHAAAEEELFYPRLLARGQNAEEETKDALTDHNDIRAGVAKAQERETGSEEWWSAVLEARRDNSDHMAEEEREAFPDFREHVEEGERQRLGGEWLAFSREHAGARGLDLEQADVGRYLREHG